MFKSHQRDGNQNPCFLVRYLFVSVLYGILTSDLGLNLHRSLSHGGVSQYPVGSVGLFALAPVFDTCADL